MKNLLFSTLALTFLFIFTGCKKEVDQPKTKTDFLTQKAWVIQAFEEKIGTAAWVDEFPTFDACSKDDQYVFRANNTYEINEGPTKCDPTDPQIFETGNWTFENNETILSLDGEDFNLERLDDTNLILSVQESFGGTVYQVRVSFRHL
jgi:hypothetical protein